MKTLTYYGADNFNEYLVTGRVVTWTQGQTQSVDDSIAAKLVAYSASFSYKSNNPALSPLTDEQVAAGGNLAVVRLDSNNKVAAVMNPDGTDASIGGGVKKYWGCVAQGKWPSYANTAASVRYIAQQISDLLYEDIDAIQFVWTRDYGFQETSAGTTSKIETSITKLDGSRMRVTYGGSNVGTIPVSGYLFSDIMPLGETRKRGTLIEHNSFVAATSATGTCGVHRNIYSPAAIARTSSAFTQPAVNSTVSVPVADSSYLTVGKTVRIGSLGFYEVTAIASGTSITLRNLGGTGAANPGDTIASSTNIFENGLNSAQSWADGQTPINYVDSGMPSYGGMGAVSFLRPVAILGFTSRQTFGLLGDSLNGEDGGSSFLTDARSSGGIINRWLVDQCAGINFSYPGQNYTHSMTQRAMLKDYFKVLVDDMGINNPSLTTNLLQTYMASYKTAFGDKPYIKATFTPYTTSSDFFTTTTNQAKDASRESHRLNCNPAIRNLLEPVDAFIDVSTAVSSGMDSGLWKPNPVSTISVNTIVSPFSSSATQLTAAAGSPFTTEYIGKVIGIPNAAVLTTGIIYAVSSDGTKALCVNGPKNTQTGVPLYVDITVYDGIHPGLASEIAVKDTANKTSSRVTLSG